MCSLGGVTLQSIYCRCRSPAHQIHQLNVGATTSGLPSVVLLLIYMIIMSAHFPLCHWERDVDIAPVRTTQQACRFCPPGSVTGICPCRMKECRVWLVTELRGHTPLLNFRCCHYYHLLRRPNADGLRTAGQENLLSTISSFFFENMVNMQRDFKEKLLFIYWFFFFAFLLMFCLYLSLLDFPFLILPWFCLTVFNTLNKISKLRFMSTWRQSMHLQNWNICEMSV